MGSHESLGEPITRTIKVSVFYANALSIDVNRRSVNQLLKVFHSFGSFFGSVLVKIEVTTALNGCLISLVFGRKQDSPKKRAKPASQS